MEDKNKCKITFDKTSLKLAINVLLHQFFFSVDSSFFRQVIGVPIDYVPAHFILNLFIYCYEN